MQKKYVLILFCFLSGAAVAQLPQNLARFTQTLKNLAAKLPAGVVPPPGGPFFDRPEGKLLKGVPSSGGVVEVEGEEVTIPPNSTVAVAKTDKKPIITVSAAGGNVEFSSFSPGGYVGVTVESEVVLPNKTVVQVPAGKYIAVEEGEGVVKITPKSGVVWPPPILPSLVPGVITVPASGKVTLADLGEEVIAPKDSTIEISDAGITIKVPAKGGKVTPPSIGAIIEVAVNSTVEIEGQPAKTVIAGGSIVSDDRIVTITPKGAVPPPLIPPGGKNIPVPSSGDVKLPGTFGTVKVSKDSKVTELPSGEVDITLSSDSSVTLANKKVIKAPKDSTIKLTEMGPDITIPVINKTIEITVPAGTGITASNDIRVEWSGGTQDLAAGGNTSIMVEGPVKVIPLAPAKPGIVSGLAPTKDRTNVLKTVGNVIQLKAPAGITDAQAISGYVDVYSAFNELSRFINGKDLALTFNQFMEPTALRSIKKRRIQVAFKNYIASIFIKPINEIPQKTIFGLTPEKLQSIYRTLIGDLVDIQAKNFVNDKYKNGTTVGQDYLEPSTVVLKGQTLIDALDPVIKKRRQYYIDELTKQKVTQAAAVVSNILALVDYLKQYTNISANIETRLDATDVLNELHKQSSFGLEEGLINEQIIKNIKALPIEKRSSEIIKIMPTGRWLHEGDIAHLVRDPIVLKAVGLPEEIKDMITIFNDLSLLLLRKTPEVLTTANPEIQGKYFVNGEILERIAKEERKNIHIFIVNAGFYFGAPNRPDQSRWVVIARYPSDEYIVVDAQDADRTKDANLTIIKDAIG